MSDGDDNEEIGNCINDINTTKFVPLLRSGFDSRLQIFKITQSYNGMEPSTNIPVHKSDIKIKTLGTEGISKQFHLSPQYYIIPRHVSNPQVYDIFSSLAGND
jgi:hypothetical protein